MFYSFNMQALDIFDYFEAFYILDAIVNAIVSSMSMSDCLLLAYGYSIDFAC